MQIDRSRVFRQAWQIHKQNGFTGRLSSFALKESWRIEKELIKPVVKDNKQVIQYEEKLIYDIKLYNKMRNDPDFQRHLIDNVYPKIKPNSILAKRINYLIAEGYHSESDINKLKLTVIDCLAESLTA